MILTAQVLTPTAQVSMVQDPTPMAQVLILFLLGNVMMMSSLDDRTYDFDGTSSNFNDTSFDGTRSDSNGTSSDTDSHLETVRKKRKVGM